MNRMLRRELILLVCLVTGISGCKRRDNAQAVPETTSPARPAQTQVSAPPFDSCALITNQEVEAIEESPVKDAKNSGRTDAGLSFAQCFYTTELFNKSVSLAVTKADSRAQPKRSIKQYWEEMFGKYENENKEREAKSAGESEGDKEKRESLREQRREREEEHESVPPKKVEGVGEQAFWIASRVGGALYVLSKDSFVRVSVGGPDPEDKKIEKCKALAEKALTRL